MQEIVANSVLPARREPVTLVTADGLRLVGELALPEQAQPRATIVCLHPLPTHGGMMDSHVFRKLAWRFPALFDIAVLRFNFRGAQSAAGRSEGAFEAGAGEGLDLAAAVDFVHARGLGDPWLVGWSFGTDVALRYGARPDVRGAVLLSPPLRWTDDTDLDRWAATGLPLTAMVPELDDYLQPAEAAQRFARVPQARVVAGHGSKHLWVGEPAVRQALTGIVETVLGPDAVLPLTWSGPMEKWSDL